MIQWGKKMPSVNFKAHFGVTKKLALKIWKAQAFKFKVNARRRGAILNLWTFKLMNITWLTQLSLLFKSSETIYLTFFLLQSVK